MNDIREIEQKIKNIEARLDLQRHKLKESHISREEKSYRRFSANHIRDKKLLYDLTILGHDIDNHPEKCRYLITDLNAKILGKHIPQNRTIVIQLKPSIKKMLYFSNEMANLLMYVSTKRGMKSLQKLFTKVKN